MEEEPPLERRWIRSVGLSTDKEEASGKMDLVIGMAGATAVRILSGVQQRSRGGDLRRRMGEGE